VFAIGDVATVRLPNDKTLPKAGVFAHSEAKGGQGRLREVVAPPLGLAFAPQARNSRGSYWRSVGAAESDLDAVVCKFTDRPTSLPSFPRSPDRARHALEDDGKEPSRWIGG
jgi:hypothetical protein